MKRQILAFSTEKHKASKIKKQRKHIYTKKIESSTYLDRLAHNVANMLNVPYKQLSNSDFNERFNKRN